MPAPTLQRRLAGLLYEALVVVAIVLLVVAIFSLAAVAAPGLSRHRPVLLALTFAALGAYFTYCWHNGQTLAMRAWKIRIVDASGAPPAWGRACLRYVLAWVWVAPPLALVSTVKPAAASLSSALAIDAGVLLAWMAVWAAAALLRPDRQFWHDVASGTRLIAA